ncbi:MAG: hypothetical protein ABJQ29_07040 [Luteolibacter sp.]
MGKSSTTQTRPRSPQRKCKSSKKKPSAASSCSALGHPRATYDLDLLIPRSATEDWKRELSQLRYSPYAETGNFLQFEAHPTFPLPPIDLMIVDDEVFRNLESHKIDSNPIATPDALSMIALKLHAINQPSRQNSAQDWSDVFALVKHHKLSLDDPDFSAIVMKHGGENAAERITAVISGRL